MHAIITIIIAGIPTRPGYYTARCDGLLFCSSGQPLFDGARELLASSCPADATLETRYAGSEVASVVSAVCATAKLTVSEESNRPQRFKRWKAINPGEGSSLIAPAPVPAASLRMGAAQ
jgi:hypothetical protein